MDQFERIRMLIGDDGLAKLRASKVAVFGIGGVGGYVCEALARSGVGALELIDHDRVSESNLNRQIIATRDSIGRLKTEVMAERIHSICPDTEVTQRPCFFLPENAGEFPFETYSYAVDAVDTVAAKIEIILCAREAGVPVISSMGTGNKMNPGELKVADITKTRVCPLARVMRREMKKRGVEQLKVVYSEEEPMVPLSKAETGAESRKIAPGSMIFVPAAAGLMIASEVVKDLLGQ